MSDGGAGSGEQTLVFGRLHDGPPAAHTELVAEMPDMGVDGSHGDRQGVRDFLVAVTLVQQQQHIPLAVRQGLDRTGSR